MSFPGAGQIRAQQTSTHAVLLDLDGTLLDTAPDMVGAMNELRREEGLDPLPFEQGRGLVSHGATALARLAFPKAAEPEFTALRERFLQIYSRRVCVETTIYAGISESLGRLESAGIPNPTPPLSCTRLTGCALRLKIAFTSVTLSATSWQLGRRA